MTKSTRDLEEAGPGSIIDHRYEVKREIARGGMGSIFEAEHLVTRAQVALKTLIRPALDLLPVHARLLREARVLGTVRHPHIVAVHDAGLCAQHGPFIALEMLEGRPLDGVLTARQQLSVGQAVAVLVELCEALEAVHARGIVHRDVKPANLMVVRVGRGDVTKLIDFGIASIGVENDVTEQKLTKHGELLGTVEYMSPEQLMGETDLDARTDVYAAGVVLYECLTGEPPFLGAPGQVIASFVSGASPASIVERRGDVPRALERVVRRALEKDREKRYASAMELAQEAARALHDAVPALALLETHSDAPSHRRADPDRKTVDANDASDRASADVQASSAAPEPQRRRQFTRAPYVAPVRVVLEAGIRDGRTEDISEGGVLVVTSAECAGNQSVKLRMPLPASGKVVTIEGVTKWIKSHRTQRAVGIEFVDLADDVRAEIQGYVRLMAVAPKPDARALDGGVIAGRS